MRCAGPKTFTDYAVLIVPLFAISFFTLSNADAFADWSRHTVQPVLGRDLTAIVGTLVITTAPALLLGISVRALADLWIKVTTAIRKNSDLNTTEAQAKKP